MSYQPLQPGFLDQVFNSTIGLPQQFMWRLIRAMEDENVDLFSEEGIADAALIPLLGVFDDHKHDVMPDYMAQKASFGLSSGEGFGSQLAAAILTDPLTYLTGGATAIAKIGKGVSGAAKASPALTKVLREAAKGSGKKLDDFSRSLTPQALQGHVGDALTAARAVPGSAGAKEVKRLSKLRETLTTNLPEAELLAKSKGMEEFTVEQALKHTRDRQIALGLPGFARFGAKYDVFPGFDSWWKLFKHGAKAGGTALTKASLTQRTMDLPWMKPIVDRASAIATAPLKGLAVGGKGLAAVSEGTTVTKEEAKLLGKFLNSETGAARIVPQLQEAIAKHADKDEDFYDSFIALYENLLKTPNKATGDYHTHEEAFKRSLRAFKIGLKDESGRELYGRLSGKGVDANYFPSWGEGASRAKPAIRKLFEDAVAKHSTASELNQSGLQPATIARTEAAGLQDAFNASTRDIDVVSRTIAQTTYNTAKKLKEYQNKIFRTGESTEFGEKIYSEFLSNTARDHDQLERLATEMFKKVKELSKGDHFFTSKDFMSIVQKMVEMKALPGELRASLKALEVNPQQHERVAFALKNYLDRHRSGMTTLEKLLKKGGVGDRATLDKILDAMSDEVFPYLEREAGEIDDVSSGYFAVFDPEIATTTTTQRQVFSPHAKRRMRRVNNKHVIRGGGVLSDEQVLRAAAGEPQAPKRYLQKFAGRQAGTLEDYELDQALEELTKAGQRQMTDAEVISEAENLLPIKQFAQRNDLTIAETVSLFRRKGAAKTRRVERITQELPELWEVDRTRWATSQVSKSLDDYGLALTQTEDGFFAVSPTKIAASTLRRSYGFNAKKQYRTYAELMGDVRKMLTDNPKYVERYGPGKIEVKRPVFVAEEGADSLSELRKLVDESSPEMGDLLRGKQKVFDADILPQSLVPDWTRLNNLKQRRALPKTHPLRDEVYRPRIEKTTKVASPRGVDDLVDFGFRIGDDIELSGKSLSTWANNYGKGRALVKEILVQMDAARRHGVPFKIDAKVLAALEDNISGTGTIISDIMSDALPQEFTELMQMADAFAGYSFDAARAAGVWAPGAPIGYLPRYFNKEKRARIAALIGDLEVEDGAILTRLGMKQAQYFKRSYDEMGLDDFNLLLDELNTIVRETTASPELQRINKELDKIVGEAGIGVKGVRNRLNITGKSLEDDPFLALIQRLGVGQQDKNLQQYFDNLLEASTGKNGESLMVGGRLIGIVDDTGNVRKYGERRVYKTRIAKDSTDRRYYESVAETASDEYIPKRLMIELPNGEIKLVENQALDNTGFGILDLGAKTPGAEGPRTAGQAFAVASLRSNLHEQVTTSALSDVDAEKLLGSQVVFGSHDNIISSVKGASETLRVTPAFLRGFDSINYGIKSFQTIFRLPFHIANLSSGVFQAYMAGASPKNLAASYVDTLRLLFGNQDFAQHSSAVSNLLDLGSESSSLGIVNVLKGEKTLVQEAARLHGGGDFSRWLAKNNPELLDSLDSFEHLVINLPDGGELDLFEFIQIAGEMQLYGTFASSLARGSRTIPDNLMRAKLNALDPGVGLAPKVLGAGGAILNKAQNLAETSEVINRTSTALALVREGHPIRRAIEITKEAHVPYEKLTPIERNVIKRASVYYTFPRHYMPWAWARFAEDPSQLSALSHFLRDQNLITTQEGTPTAVIGDQRVNLARLNANLEAAGLVAGFSDFLMGIPEAAGIQTGATASRQLRNQYSMAGFGATGGLFSLIAPQQIGVDPARAFQPQGDIWQRSTEIVWPFKIMDMMRKDEKSPYVSYTPLEQWFIDNNVFGVGARKVRPEYEAQKAIQVFRQNIKSLQLRAAATENSDRRQALFDQAQELSQAVRQLVSESQQKALK